MMTHRSWPWSLLFCGSLDISSASDAYEAIRILADRHIDLLVADIRMPGLSGAELAMQAKVMRPTLRIIFITGFADAARKVRGRVMQKPIRAADLIQTVKKRNGGGLASPRATVVPCPSLISTFTAPRTGGFTSTVTERLLRRAR
jgi:DNA-binding LytR/AlgR family response regulator